MPRQQDHNAFDLEFICEEMPYWGSLTHARSARFGFCCHANSLGEHRSGTSRGGPPLAPAGDIPAALGLKTFLKETRMIDHPDGLDYMAFCFAVFGAPSGISGAESRIVSCNHSRADF